MAVHVPCRFQPDDALADLCNCYPEAAGILRRREASLPVARGSVADAVARLQAAGHDCSADELLRDLAIGVRWPDEHEVITVSTWDLHELVDHIENCHHRRLRSELARLERLLEGTADAALDQRLAAFHAEVEEHLVEEEEELFPLVRRLSHEDAVPDESDALARDLEHDHRDLAADLAGLSRAIRCLPFADQEVREAVEVLLDDLREDLALHSEEEDALLLPDLLHLLEIGRRRPGS